MTEGNKLLHEYIDRRIHRKDEVINAFKKLYGRDLSKKEIKLVLDALLFGLGKIVSC